MSMFTPKRSNMSSHTSSMRGKQHNANAESEGTPKRATKKKVTFPDAFAAVDELEAYLSRTAMMEETLDHHVSILQSNDNHVVRTTNRKASQLQRGKEKAVDLIFSQWQRAQKELEASQAREMSLQHRLEQAHEKMNVQERTINDLQFKLFFLQSELEAGKDGLVEDKGRFDQEPFIPAPRRLVKRTSDKSNVGPSSLRSMDCNEDEDKKNKENDDKKKEENEEYEDLENEENENKENVGGTANTVQVESYATVASSKSGDSPKQSIRGIFSSINNRRNKENTGGKPQLRTKVAAPGKFKIPRVSEILTPKMDDSPRNKQPQSNSIGKWYKK